MRRRPCTKCGKNRAEKFFEKRADGYKVNVCKTCKNAAGKVHYAANAQRSRDLHLLRKYGITSEEYSRILAAQGGVCGICKGKRRGNMDVDHSHDVEKALIAEGVAPQTAARRSVRGICCRRCNRYFLPITHDSVDFLHDAIDYLTNWPADSVLGAEQPPL